MIPLIKVLGLLLVLCPINNFTDTLEFSED
jgi:hypothetical protein